ncbi:hypothetical protein OH76DRAFT_1490463 [Lentinus brumalis]|uniref:Ribonuclease H1 N-terminal domain-containing protein n=1 Tax=Lentinus brumalis TaxID=2498619 RepID=A0A371CIY6_9APHY|nr:hypothetical protein OH76DRAFT_1490463 [Polyporus brumalis]
MTEDHKPTVDTTDSHTPATATGYNSAEGAGMNSTPGGETMNPLIDGLPDLSGLSLGSGDDVRRAGGTNGRAGRTGGGNTPGAQVLVGIYSQGGPVTVNIHYGGPAPRTDGHRAPHIVRSPVGVIPPASPARIRLGAPLPSTTAHAASTVTAVAAQANPAAPPPLSPVLQALGAAAPPSPSLESVPNTASPAIPGTPLPVWETTYEYIAPRDPAHTRWYVVTAGRRVGIWRDWLDMGDYVNGVPGNQHKSFKTRADAEQHYYGNKAMGNVQVIMP